MFQQTPGADWTPFGRPALGPRKVRDKETTRGTKRKTRSPRQRLEMVVRVRPVLALIFVPLFAQPPRQTIYHNEGNGSFEQNSLAPGKSLQQWFVRHELARFPTFSFAASLSSCCSISRVLMSPSFSRVLHDPLRFRLLVTRLQQRDRRVIALTFSGYDATLMIPVLFPLLSDWRNGAFSKSRIGMFIVVNRTRVWRPWRIILERFSEIYLVNLLFVESKELLCFGVFCPIE